MKSRDISEFYDASVHARLACEVAAKHGFEGPPLLAAAGLDPDAVAVPYGRIPASGLAMLFREVIRLTGDENLGLRMGEVPPVRRIGIVGHSIKANPRARESMIEAHAALRAVCNTVELLGEFDGEPARVAIRVEFEEPVYRRQIAEFHASAYFTTGIHFNHPAFRFEELCFQHDAPGDITPYREYFGCPVKFSQPSNSLSFESGWLDREMLSADHDLLEALAPYVRGIMESFGTPNSWKDRVRAEALALLERGELELESLCRRLGLKPRTLQHKLRGEHTTFSRVVDDVRRDLALKYLTGQNAPAAEIAYLLGFEELGSFYRAFRRWTGTTPQAYRAAGSASEPRMGSARSR